MRILARRHSRPRNLASIALLSGVVLVVAAGCATSNPGGEGAGPPVRVAERDFKISAPKRLKGGNITLAVRNRGPDAHELIVIRSSRRELPLRTDGLTVDEEALERATVGVLEPGEPGMVRSLRLKLAPGSYELICNMSGHYLGGMHARLVVV